MNSLTLKVLNEKAGRPIGNSFKAKTVRVKFLGNGIWEVGTGIAISLPQDTSFSVVSLRRDVYILSHHVDDKTGELVILALTQLGKLIRCGKEPADFAVVTIVEQSVQPVRFVESKEGKRVIVGGPEEVIDG